MSEMLFEYWDNEGNGDEFAPVSEHNDRLRACLSPDAKCLFSLRASSWFQALEMQYERLGYGPFVPPEGIEDYFYSDDEVAAQSAYLRVRKLG